MSEESTSAVDGWRRPAMWDLLAPLVAALTIGVAAWAGRDLWFFSDDWNIYAYYHDGHLLEPFNGHLSLVPAGLYQLLFHTVGVGSYVPYRLCGLVALGVLAFQVIRLTRSRLGPARRGSVQLAPLVAALVVAAILWNPSGTMNLLFPFLMNFTIPIAALAAVWWHLDRDRLRNDVAASVWLAVALATSGLGLMVMAAVGVELLISRAPWRRWLVLSPGPVLWAIWFVTHRDANEVSTDVGAIASYSARMYLGATTSLAAGWRPGGVLVAVAFVVFVALAAWRWRSLDARSIGALAAPVAFVVFTAVTRIDIVPAIAPDELRYSWTIAAYLVLAVVVLARPSAMFDVRVPAAGWVGLAGAATVVVTLGAAQLLPDLVAWNDKVADARPGLSSLVFTTEAIGRERIDPTLVIPVSFVPVTAGAYLDAVASVGSPVAGVGADGLGGDEYVRSVSDQNLVQQLPIELVGPIASEDAPCAPPTATSTEVRDLTVPPGTALAVRATGAGEHQVTVRRITPPGDAVGVPVPTALDMVLVVPRDAPNTAEVDLDYVVSVPSGVSVAVCP